MASPRRGGGRRFRRRALLISVLAALAAYAVFAANSLGATSSDRISVANAEGDVPAPLPADGVVLELTALDIDAASGSLELRVQPTPRGRWQGNVPGELSRPVQVRVSSADPAGSAGASATAFDFPDQQILDPVTATVAGVAEPRRFPFDQPEMTINLTVLHRGEPVPSGIVLTNATEGWDLSATGRPADDGLALDVRATRETLAISFDLFYIVGTAVVTLIALAVIAGALSRRTVDFDRVIWLGAMLVVIPAVRNEMPGVPPVGTTVDLVVFLPSVLVVAVALLVTIALLTIDEVTSRAPAPAPESG